MPETTSSEHNHYWPSDLIPISPQARRFGYTMDVYVTKRVWKSQCSWQDSRSNTDKRIYEILRSCFNGLSKALAVNDDMVSFTFKHWSLSQNPKARKQIQYKLGARLLLNPGTEAAWLLIFDPENDTVDELTRGERPNDKDRRTDNEVETLRNGDSPGVE